MEEEEDVSKLTDTVCLHSHVNWQSEGALSYMLDELCHSRYCRSSDFPGH